MDYGMLNLGSLACGLAGWVVPWLSGVRRPPVVSRQYLRGLISMGLCALALWFQIRYQRHLVDIQDWSALMDTSGAVAGISAFLLISTLLDNLLAWVWTKADGRLEEERP